MFVNVSGRKQWMEVAGSGSPVVVLESGCGGGAADWQQVQRELAGEATVVAYDRAGSGQSERSTSDRRVSVMCGELREMLDAAALSPPFVLVGLSLGGLIVREFARRYRSEVCGLLLVEPAHEDLELVMPSDYWAHEHEALERAAAESRQSRPGFAAELESLAHATAELRSHPDHHLGDLPLTVITAKKKWGDVPPGIDCDAVDRAWVSLHEKTAALSTRGRRVEAPASGHNVHRDDPQLLLRELRALLRTCV